MAAYQNRVSEQLTAILAQLPQDNATLTAFATPVLSQSPGDGDHPAFRLAGGAASPRTRWPSRSSACPGHLKHRLTQTSTGWLLELLNDDMPFLVDSLMAELQRQQMPATLVLHPILMPYARRARHPAADAGSSHARTGAYRKAGSGAPR